MPQLTCVKDFYGAHMYSIYTIQYTASLLPSSYTDVRSYVYTIHTISSCSKQQATAATLMIIIVVLYTRPYCTMYVLNMHSNYSILYEHFRLFLFLRLYFISYQTTHHIRLRGVDRVLQHLIHVRCTCFNVCCSLVSPKRRKNEKKMIHVHTLVKYHLYVFFKKKKRHVKMQVS